LSRPNDRDEATTMTTKTGRLLLLLLLRRQELSPGTTNTLINLQKAKKKGGEMKISICCDDERDVDAVRFRRESRVLYSY